MQFLPYVYGIGSSSVHKVALEYLRTFIFVMPQDLVLRFSLSTSISSFNFFSIIFSDLK
jgi:hypothetical protein